RFLVECYFELPHLNLELGYRLGGDVEVAESYAISGGGVDQHRKVIVLAIVPLKTEARTAQDERVGRCAIAFVAAVIALEVAVRHDLELTVRAPDEEVLPIPSGARTVNSRSCRT